MIKIGFSAYNEEGKFIKNNYKRRIERFHKTSELLFYKQGHECYEALSNNDIKAIAVSLENLPTTLPEGITIAALTGRTRCEVCLLTFPPKNYSDALFNLPENPLIWSPVDIISLQFKEIIPTTTFKKALIGEIITEMECVADIRNTPLKDLDFTQHDIDEMLNGGLVSQTYLTGNHKINDGNLDMVSFHPSEITSLPGAGVVAFLAKADDLETRRFFKDIHNEECGEIINVERKLKKMFNDKDIAAHCIKDEDGNYHLYAAAIVNGQLKRCQISQSTFFELAEKGYSYLVG